MIYSKKVEKIINKSVNSLSKKYKKRTDIISLKERKKTTNILVTIVCLTYNHEKYISKCLDGFLMQKTNFGMEIIIHDDASNDRTQQIINEYHNKYPDIIKPILQKENQYSKGIPITQTYILPNINGKYVAFCEGDDYWCNPYKIQSQIDFLEQNDNYSASCHRVIMLDNISEKVSVIGRSNKSITIDNEFLIKRTKKTLNYCQTSSLVARTKFLIDKEKIDLSNHFPVGDIPMQFYLLTKGPINNSKEIMSVYRLFSTNSSWSSTHCNDKKREIHNEKMIGGIRYFQKANTLNKKQTMYLNNAIFQYSLDKKIKEKDYSGSFRSEFKIYLRSCKAKDAISVWMQVFCPKLYNAIKKCHIKNYFLRKR